MKDKRGIADTLKLARFWFTCLWEPRKLMKAIERPGYRIMLLNVLVPPVAVSIFGIYVIAGGLQAVDLGIYAKTLIVSALKYSGVAIAYGMGAVAWGKGSLHRMACFVSFPIAGYLLLVDATLIIGNPVAGVPISIVLKSLLIAFVFAVAGIAHAESGMKWWKAGAWILVVLAAADFLAPFLGTML